jgi:hypothetical protein
MTTTVELITALFYEVVYLHPADKYPRLTYRPS